LRIALIGTRGIPARYGGFETAVQNLAGCLAGRGHEVTVYCRSREVSEVRDEFVGARLVHMPTIANKYLDTLANTATSSMHLVARLRPDIACYFIAGNSPLLGIPKLARVPAVINVDGLDWEREKWPGMAKRYIQFAEWLAPRLAPVITDSREVQRYYRRKYGRETIYIPYGADPPADTGTDTLERFGLAQRGYVLFVGRLVPENKVHLLTRAFARTKADLKLCIVGGSSYEDDYVHDLKASADSRTVFTGYLFGEGYDQLRAHAYAIVVPHGSGGTHPVLVEALAAGGCVIANDTPPNREVVGDAGLLFSEKAGAPQLEAQLARIVDAPDFAAELRARARERADFFSWDRVTDAYEAVMNAVLEGRSPQEVSGYEAAAGEGSTPPSVVSD
jgi:glycosyltransferase involved in cell wall biosynthesis